jgi:hypothetical protein
MTSLQNMQPADLDSWLLILPEAAAAGNHRADPAGKALLPELAPQLIPLQLADDLNRLKEIVFDLCPVRIGLGINRHLDFNQGRMQQLPQPFQVGFELAHDRSPAENIRR